MPKEFVLFSDNHALQFINSQPKLNQRHVKWEEFFQKFTFVIKHTSGKSNKVDDSLSRVNMVLQEIKVSTLGFENLVDMYKEELDFKGIYAAYENPVSHNKIQWLDCMLQEAFIVQG